MSYTDPSLTSSYSISEIAGLLFPDDMARTHQRRVQAYRKYWLYYLGKHWSYLRDANDPLLTMNYCRKIVDLHTNFAFKKGFDISIPDDPSTSQNEKEDREFVRYTLEETWRRNNKNLWCLEAGQSGAITGDVFVRVSWDVNDPLEDPYARADIIPSHLVFPEFGGPYGVDRKKLKRILIVNPVYRDPPSATNYSLPSAHRGLQTMTSVDMVYVCEEWLAPIMDKQGKIIRPALVRYYEDKVLIEEKENPLGEIPIIHIPNYPLSGEYYGLSDLADITELNKELNEKGTDISDIINYHASPQTIIYGAKLKDLEKGANRTWALPEGAKVENLELKGDLVAASAHWQNLKTSMLELSSTPEQVLGKLTSSSVAPSGVSLQMQYLPLMEKRDAKVLTYGLGIRLINRMMLKITEVGDPAFGKKMKELKGNKYRNDVTFSNPLPQDEVREVSLSRERLDLGLTTRRLELEKDGFSQGEIERIIDESREEKKEDMELGVSFDTARKAGSNAATRGGPDEIRGEKIVENNLKKNSGMTD